MRDTYLVYPQYTLRIHPLRPEADVTTPPVTPRSYGPTDFVSDFRQLGDNVRAPQRALAGSDFGVARNLLRQHTKPALLEYARLYWQMHFGDIRDDMQRSPMLHFASRLPLIKRDLGESQ